MSEKQTQTGYEINPLEDGEPVYDFSAPGTRVDLTQAFQEMPTGMALVKLADTRVVAMNRRAMVLLNQPDTDGNFHKEAATIGTTVREAAPGGLPEAAVGEAWLDLGEVERVAVRPGYAYEQQPGVDPQAPMPGRNMFDSAQEILADFEDARQNG